jgi:uncharacterized membrane protein YGL010W
MSRPTVRLWEVVMVSLMFVTQGGYEFRRPAVVESYNGTLTVRSGKTVAVSIFFNFGRL